MRVPLDYSSQLQNERSKYDRYRVLCSNILKRTQLWSAGYSVPAFAAKPAASIVVRDAPFYIDVQYYDVPGFGQVELMYDYKNRSWELNPDSPNERAFRLYQYLDLTRRINGKWRKPPVKWAVGSTTGDALAIDLAEYEPIKFMIDKNQFVRYYMNYGNALTTYINGRQRYGIKGTHYIQLGKRFKSPGLFHVMSDVAYLGTPRFDFQMMCVAELKQISGVVGGAAPARYAFTCGVVFANIHKSRYNLEDPFTIEHLRKLRSIRITHPDPLRKK